MLNILSDSVSSHLLEGGYSQTFKLGRDKLVAGFERALLSLAAGDHATVTIAPAYGYGDAVVEGIPPGSTIEFDVVVASTAASATVASSASKGGRHDADAERLKAIRAEREAAAAAKAAAKAEKELATAAAASAKAAASGTKTDNKSKTKESKGGKGKS